ncbi:MAG: sugar ABC transporter permease [Desulfurococcaceae archaeon]
MRKQFSKGLFNKGRALNPWLMILPAFLILLIFNIFPLLWSLGISFYRFSVIIREIPKYVGGLNYINVITSVEAWDRIIRTGIYLAYSLSFQFGLGLLLSLLLFEDFKGKRMLITLFTIPLMIAPVASSLFFRYLFDENLGPVNNFLKSITGYGPLWFSSDISPLGIPYALLTVILVETWIWTPFVMFLLTAGMSSIPQDLIEQSRVDSLKFRHKFRYVILPYIKPMIALALIFRFMDSLKTFDSIYILTAGGPGATTELISVYIYRVAFERWDFGSATALSYLILVIVIFMTNVFMRYILGGERS